MPRKAKPQAGPKQASSPAIKKEVKYLGLAAGGVLLLVGVLVPGAVGPVGAFIRGLLLGLFGAGAFVVPPALIAVAVLGLLSKSIRLPLVHGSVLFWFVLGFLHIFNRMIDRLPEAFVSVEMGMIYRYASPSGGGVFGAVLGELLRSFLGSVGSIIALVVGIVILLILLTGKSFVGLVGKGVYKAKDIYEERATKQYEYYDDYEEELPQLKKQKPRKRPRGVLPPLPERRRDAPSVKNGEPDFISIDENYPEETPKILLVNEELEDSKKNIDRGPLFAKRGVVRKPAGEVVEFRPKPADEPAPIIKGLVEDEPDEPVEDEPAEPVLFAQNVEEIEIDDDIEGGVLPSEPLKINENGSSSAWEEPEEQEHDDIIIPIKKAVEAPRFVPMPVYENYQLPSIQFLAKNERPQGSADTRAQVHKNSLILEETLRNFRIEAKVVEVSIGPSVTRYDLAPGPGVKVSSIANLSNDLALSLAAQGIRIEAPIPGKSAVGIEIPNKDPQGVFLREILEDEKFETFQSKLAFAVGKDIAGSPVVTDIARMPHLLIAGATGSGKSVCINTLIASLLYKARPDEVKLLMIDPKVVELSVYNGIPHLLIPVVTDPKKASGALNWAVQEMENRYAAFAETGRRDLKGYNRHMLEQDEQKLPQIVIIIDELADLMMTAKGEVEESICRLAQKARAAGIHLIVATQRPSVDVITGLIKANIPSRLAFAVSSGTDSRTVLDMYGAEKLLGRGDMLFLPVGQNKPIRVQGGFISDKEVEELVTFLKAQAPTEFTTEMIQQVTMPGKSKVEGEVDEFFHDAVEFLLVKGKASTSMLQRQFRIGYNRASRLMDDLELRGIVGPEDGVKPRKVTITREEYREIYG